MKRHFPRIEPLEARIAPAFSSVFQLSSLNGATGFVMSGVASNDEAGFSVSDVGDINGDGFDDVIIGAPGSDANGSSNGANYVVFGRADGFAPSLDLSTLNGINGFRLDGAAVDYLGSAASGAGDVNGDGFDDLIVGAPRLASYTVGVSYVIFGTASPFPAALNLSTLNGSNGFKINGAVFGDGVGSSVGSAGDVNGDGFDDVIVGAPGVTSNGNGASYVVFGRAGGFAPNLSLSALNGSNGFKLTGVGPNDHSGRAVSSAGDVNGDGFSDLIIGAPNASPNRTYSGASYVVFGKTNGFAANLNLSALDGSNGFRLSGAAIGDRSGVSVSAAGDVNGDGFGDVIVGADYADSNRFNSGASYVVFGKADRFLADLIVSALDGQNGFKLTGVKDGEYSGHSVSAAGDVNGDGFGDLLIGAPGANATFSGASYVVFGKSNGFVANLNLSALNGSTGFKITGIASNDGSGRSVSAAGDVNGDGFGDLIIGAPSADPHGSYSGASYIVFGRGVDVNISDATIIEGTTGTAALHFTVSLSEAGAIPFTVEVAAANGTALAGSDYGALSKTVLTFAPGELIKSVIVDVIGDTLFETNESFSVVLSNATGGVIRDGTGIGTIVNDELPPLVGIAGASVLESDSGTSSLVFTVSLSEPSGLPATVSFASADGTALVGSDYTALIPGTLTFAPGETTKTIAIDVHGDTAIEDHEQLSVVLSAPSGATLGTALAAGTILNDDTAIHISRAASILEGDAGMAPLVFTVSLEKPSALPVTVNYATIDGTAAAGSDFVGLAPGSQITFAPGETTKTITVEVLGDTSVEAHETFSLALSDAANAAIASGTGTATILNDDTLVRIDDASVLEGHAGMRAITFTISLAAETALPVSVNFATADGTATGGTDYVTLTPGTITFAPGETNKTVTVEALGDITAEQSETFSLVLSEAANAVIDRANGIGTILDDDVTVIGKHKATFTDVDGDLVTIKVNKGTLKVEDFTLFPSGSGSQLALVDFSGDSEFAGLDLSITAKHAVGTPHGVRSVDVGYINASGVDLGTVVIKGDLGRINAGDDADRKPGVLRLSANSIGRMGIDTQLPGGSLESDIAGALRVLTLGEGMQDATLSVSGDIGSVIVKGSLIGSAIRSDGNIGAVTISGDVAGDGMTPSVLSARGILNPTAAGKAVAIRSIHIGGSVDQALILSGYDRTGVAFNADAAIGEIVVSGDWKASSVAAGATAGMDELFGTQDDLLISGGNPIVAKIASILIKGAASGSGDETENSGFIAEQIGAFKSGGAKLALTSGPGNDLAGLPVGSGVNLMVREVA